MREIKEKLRQLLLSGVRLNLIIIALNVLVFVYIDFFEGFFGTDWLSAGASGWVEVIQQGQVCRVFTAMFIHADFAHLFNNMLVLAFMGTALEQEIGTLRYGILYVAAGILANCGSLFYHMSQNAWVVSVGASGAIFGTVGAMLFLVLFHRERRTHYSTRQLVWMTFLTLYGGFAGRGTDNAAHVVGFIAGFLLAALLTVGQNRQRRQNSQIND